MQEAWLELQKEAELYTQIKVYLCKRGRLEATVQRIRPAPAMAKDEPRKWDIYGNKTLAHPDYAAEPEQQWMLTAWIVTRENSASAPATGSTTMVFPFESACEAAGTKLANTKIRDAALVQLL